MELKTLDKSKHLDLETECLYRYVRSDTEYFRPHNHNFYEIFLMNKGRAQHLVNGKEQNLSEGELLFIRDFDIHDYRSVKGEPFEFMNLAFSKETFESLCLYLGDAFPKKALLSAAMPPAVILSKKDKERLFFALADIPQNAEKNHIKLKARILLSNIFTSYFLNFTEKTNEIPIWLEITVEKMKSPKNFIMGVGRMYEIAGKSREHISRSLKEHYGVSPTTFINDLRLEYSANLLITSNLSVIEIGYESGFENTSWFYKAFQRKYGMPPLKYRKVNYKN